jgi:phenylacetate-coenzyme A ligase PaaK-like adenylate-forming protein
LCRMKRADCVESPAPAEMAPGNAAPARFVSPERVDRSQLEQAVTWFDAARGRPEREIGRNIDDESWPAIPITHKDDLRTRLRAYPETGRWIAELRSSGTTAAPVVSPWSEADERVAEATAREIHGLCPSVDGARCAVIAPDPSLAVAHSMCREIQLSGGLPCLIAPQDPRSLAAALVGEGIEVLFTLPLVASRLGEYFHATRGGTPAQIRLVFCGGDVLSPARQALLAQLWDARVINLFGCSELFGPVAGPSEHADPFAWHCGPVAVEVINRSTGSPCRIGERGVMVLTTLWPKASPLLRYWTDDIVEVTAAAVHSGAFGFHYVGRHPSILGIGHREVALRDIDDALLGMGGCGSEWAVWQAGDTVRIEAEMTDPSATAVRSVSDLLREMICARLEFAPCAPGSLPRATPKFVVLRD